MGVAGSGKSTMGATLARALNCPFLEGDDFHSPEAITRMRGGTPLTDDDRLPWLDRLGRAVCAEAGKHGIVVAACSALRKAYRSRLQALIPVRISFVVMDTDIEELSRRLTERKQHYMPPSLLASQLDTLERPQSDEVAIVLDARRPPAALCEQIVAWLSNQEK